MVGGRTRAELGHNQTDGKFFPDFLLFVSRRLNDNFFFNKLDAVFGLIRGRNAKLEWIFGGDFRENEI